MRTLATALVVVLLTGCGAARRAPTPWAGIFPEADTVRVTRVAPGVVHAYLWLPRGPWAVHVIEVDEGVCAPEIAAVKAGPPLAARAPTSALARDGLAAINADFFMDPGGTPVGPHVRNGRVLVGPGSRPAYVLDTAGHHGAGVPALSGFVAAAGDTAVLGRVNRPLQPGRHHPVRPGLALFDRWYGRGIAEDGGGRLRLERVPLPGQPGAAVVRSIAASGDTLTTDSAHVVLAAVGLSAGAWLARRAVGDTVVWQAGVTLDPGGAAPAPEAAESVGGFPLLVAGGAGVYGEQAGVIESFGEARHPRTAAGWNEATRRLLWVVVDGRQAPYSDGMSLPELEWLLLRLGAADALNLDGGGSTTMVVDGVVANRPSDEAGERPVANALVLRSCRR